MEIPEALLSQIREGRAILLLGSGASLDSRNLQGQPAPNSDQLATALAKQFLSDSHVGHDLMTVAELAISETNLPTVQDYIAKLFADLEPSIGHSLLPTFRWHGLATTNYDRLIEVAYDRKPDRAQALVPLLSDSDLMDDVLRHTANLPLLKLHGCVTRTRDEKLPFILTPDQYVSHRKHRKNLFLTFKEWAAENTLVAIGHSLRDPDLRRILLELDELGSSRLRYYIVSPEFTAEESRLWEGRRVTSIRGTFSDFLSELDTRIPSPLRRVAVKHHDEHPITRHLNRPLVEDTLEYLTTGATFVHAAMKVDSVRPIDFYRGISPDWAAVTQDIDVRRRLEDTLLYDVIITDEADRRSATEFYVVKAEAGAGKSVSLQRVAWEAATEAHKLCLFVNASGKLRYEPIADISRAASQRIFLFVDNAADNVQALNHILQRSRHDGLLLTAITAERQNQWNIYCERLEGQVTGEYRLRYLNRDEIRRLVGLLERHQSLGYLEALSESDRISELEERAGRQLLVALLEATRGRPHQEILVDEFEHIVPERARTLYLTVCVLNRLSIPVRAGLIARVHGIPFSEFRQQLFQPLDHVVRVREDHSIRDYVYLARHPLIAQVVFERILRSPARKFDEYLRLIGALNLSYATDLAAFRRMVRGRLISNLFPSHEDATAIFDTAMEVAPNDVHVTHQRGIYEMRSPNGNLETAYNLLTTASSMANNDPTITHSLAELERIRGELASSELQQKKHRDEAVRLASSLKTDPVQGPYGYHTILKTHIGRLRESLRDPEGLDDDIDRLIQEIEETIDVARQRFPGDEYILTAEAEFAGILHDETRAQRALERAFERNQRSPYIASRLSRMLSGLGLTEKAIQVLESAVESNPSNQQLNFAYAMILRDTQRDDPETILHHLRRSFVSGDRNYEAQFWYGCYLYMKDTSDSIKESRDVFRELWASQLPYRSRTNVRAYFTGEDGSKLPFTGVVRRREDSYGWIDRDGRGDSVMVREQNLGSDVWGELWERARVRFEIGFCFGGPVATNVSRIRDSFA